MPHIVAEHSNDIVITDTDLQNLRQILIVFGKHPPQPIDD